MCIACILWEKGKITKDEVDRGLSELINEDTSEEELKHIQETIERIFNDIS